VGAKVRHIATSDGAELAVHDFGAGGPVALITHGTGLCAAMAAPLVSGLAGEFHALALDTRAHGLSPSPPNGDVGRARLATDVLEAVAALGAPGETIGIGHSSGAHSLLAAESRRPGTFRMLLCYEPMVAANREAASADTQKLLDAALQRTLRRRAHFASRAEARAHFAGRGTFANLDEEALAGFIAEGLEDDPEGGVRLACSPQDEAAIYASGVDYDEADLAVIPCPVRFAYGARNAEHGGASVRQLASRIRDASVTELAGIGHFGPFEDPALFAAWIVEMHRTVAG